MKSIAVFSKLPGYAGRFLLLFATLVIVVMKLFRAGIFGLVAARLKARGLISAGRRR